ncbi:MAG: PEP-CTERM sorting domain-containing protein [Methylococcales bacterium]|nr:PEP-CTERM sorting domain-containing protein [Methylococcales bacterium]
MKNTLQNKLYSLVFVTIIAIGLSASPASAMTIDKILNVNVHVLCNDSGLNCASKGPAGNAFFSAETNKIWAQAGISVSFNLAQTINSTAFSFLNDSVAGDSFYDLIDYAGFGYSASIVDMFLVHTVTGVYGEGFMGYGGLVIAMDTVMAFNSGLGRIDTIAHELGHNLDLVQPALGGDPGGHSNSSHPNYLMASGSWRTVPATLANIAPSGSGLDLLPADQIAHARLSKLLHDVPETSTFALLALGLFGLGVMRRRVAFN